VETDDELWSAIADPSRRQILDLLVRNGETTATSLASHVSFSRQAVTKHLAVLEEAGLVSRRKHGREVLHRVDPGRLDEAARALGQLATEWDRRLSMIKQLAENAYSDAPSERSQNRRDNTDR
jgi:ArsR family transcriptional regulator, cadmium/lead-responsive transcriptional repressor